MPKPRKYLGLPVNLVREDLNRLAQVAATENKTQGQVAREAIRWYLAAYEKLKTQEIEDKISERLDKNFNRLIAFLVPFRVELGTLYQLTFEATPEDIFEAAVNTTKQRLRKKLADDEQKLAAGLKRNMEQ